MHAVSDTESEPSRNAVERPKVAVDLGKTAKTWNGTEMLGWKSAVRNLANEDRPSREKNPPPLRLPGAKIAALHVARMVTIDCVSCWCSEGQEVSLWQVRNLGNTSQRQPRNSQ